MTEFGEYLRAGEPEKREKAIVWRTAIGLRQVDGLTTSDCLNETARRNIEGEITLEDAGRLIAEYYKSKPVKKAAAKTRTDEADIVAQRIKVMKGEMSAVEMMSALKLAGRRNFLEKHLSPEIAAGFVEMTQPDSPCSPTQKYRLAAKGWRHSVRPKRRWGRCALMRRELEMTGFASRMGWTSFERGCARGSVFLSASGLEGLRME